MEIRNHLNGLNGTSNSSPVSNQTEAAAQNTDDTAKTMQNIDRATLSVAGAGISQSAPDADVRWEKVASIQKAVADGTYNVPASAVASKMIDAMLGKRS